MKLSVTQPEGRSLSVALTSMSGKITVIKIINRNCTLLNTVVELGWILFVINMQLKSEIK